MQPWNVSRALEVSKEHLAKQPIHLILSQPLLHTPVKFLPCQLVSPRVTPHLLSALNHTISPVRMGRDTRNLQYAGSPPRGEGNKTRRRSSCHGINGLVVEFVVAIDQTCVQFIHMLPSSMRRSVVKRNMLYPLGRGSASKDRSSSVSKCQVSHDLSTSFVACIRAPKSMCGFMYDEL